MSAVGEPPPVLVYKLYLGTKMDAKLSLVHQCAPKPGLGTR